MICLGVDPGQSRVGVALGQGSLAIALQTTGRATAVSTIIELLAEKQAERIYLGLPLSLTGATTKSTQSALELAKELQAATPIPIFLLDERLTTVASTKSAIAIGKSTKDSRGYIDAEAARHIVESAIASNHTLGQELGDYLARNT